MLYSSDYKFLFIHVPKTAGSSLHRVLQPLSVEPKRTLMSSLTRRLPIVEPPDRAHFRIHDTARTIRAKLSPTVYDGLTSFAAVRNPFDHAVSHYEYMKQYRSPKIAERFAGISFIDYLQFRAQPMRTGDRLFVRMPHQSYFLCDADGQRLVTKVLKFETIDADYAALAETLGLPVHELPRVNATKSRKGREPFQTYYDDKAVDLVRRIYAPDFETFGYAKDLPEST